jgi:hypothetical protein
MIDWIPIEEWELVDGNFLIYVVKFGSSNVYVFTAYYENEVIKVNDGHNMTFYSTSPFKWIYDGIVRDQYYITHAAKINCPIVAEKQEVVDDKYNALLARVVAMEKAIKRKEATYMKIFKKKDRV